jgi:phosphate transport system ATP-binding protein
LWSGEGSCLMESYPHIRVQDLNIWYGRQQALKDITIAIPANGITAIVGPSGCGKTTLLRSLNRLLETTGEAAMTGQVFLDDADIYGPDIDVTEVRTRIGMLASKPFPLPMSIYDNVAYGPRIHGRCARREMDHIVEHHLRAADLWNEVRDRLQVPAAQLSTGQQQRLCLARALAVEPEVLLCDEPTAALDPISARRVEDLLRGLKDQMTIVVVTHMLRQARRVADYVAFLWLGELVEAGAADQVFYAPRDDRTRAYLSGDIG